MRISKFLYPPSIARCQHVKVNGVQCGSPALKNRKLCHFHQRWQQGRIQLNANQARRSRYSLDLPILEDANSIQVALMQGMRLLLTNQVDHKTAALLFYALQTASTNLSRTTFEPRPQQVIIDPRSIADTSLGDDAWYKEEFTEDDQEVKEANEVPAADLPQTVNIQAMAECPAHAQLGQAVSNLRVGHPSFRFLKRGLCGDRSRVALQKLQRLVVELPYFFIDRRVRTAFKDQQLGIANITGHPIREASGGRQVVTSECYLRGRGNPAKVRFRVVGYHGIRLLDESRERLRWPAHNKVCQGLNVVRLGGIKLWRKAPGEDGANHHLGNTVQRFRHYLPTFD